MKHADEHCLQTVLLAGQTDNIPLLENAGFAMAININPPDISLNEALNKETAIKNLQTAVLSLYLY